MGYEESVGATMSFSEADTRAKLIDPALHDRDWTENLICREETAGAVGIGEGRTVEGIWGTRLR